MDLWSARTTPEVSVTLDSLVREAGDLLHLLLVFLGLGSAFAPLSTVWTAATDARMREAEARVAQGTPTASCRR